MIRRRRHDRRLVRPGRRLGSVLLVVLGLAFTSPARAGDLVFWESSSSPGVPLALAPPVTSLTLDIDYGPTTAEGGGLYGMSEILVFATGDLTLSSTGFSCQTFGCLYSPSPFTGGTSVLLSGADNLPGEFDTTRDLITLTFSGTNGYVAVASGRYLDATGVLQSLGTIQEIDPQIIAEVPEPGLPVALGLGSVGAFAAARRRRRDASGGAEGRPGRDVASVRVDGTRG